MRSYDHWINNEHPFRIPERRSYDGLPTVNPYWLEVPLGPLVGLADGDEEDTAPFEGIGPEDEAAYRTIIRKYIVPYVHSIDIASLELLKRTFLYYLSKNNVPWERLFDSLLIPFDCPRIPRSFFVWVWEECFPNDALQVVDLSLFQVVSDTEDPRLSIRFTRDPSRTDTE